MNVLRVLLPLSICSCIYAETAQLPIRIVGAAMEISKEHDCTLLLEIHSKKSAKFNAWIKNTNAPNKKLTTQAVKKLVLTEEILAPHANAVLMTDQPKGSMRLSIDVEMKKLDIPISTFPDYMSLYKYAKSNLEKETAAFRALEEVIPPGMEFDIPVLNKMVLLNLKGGSVTLSFEDGSTVEFFPDENERVCIPVVEDWKKRNPKLHVPNRENIRI